MAKPSLVICELPKEQEDMARDVLSRVAGQWVLWVLYVLANATEPMRFTRVLEAVEGITQKVLTQTLRSLERDGFVARTIYPQVPPRVEYELTKLGRDLVDHVDPLVGWARRHVAIFQTAQRRFDRVSRK
tara:strand:+ start:3855 stop:4244 length:390 start_codon:yes stop_codon:yes gene_type:complete